MFKQNLRNQQPFNLLPKSPEPYQERRWQSGILHSLTLNHAFSLGHGSIKVLPTPDNMAQQRNKGMAKNHSKSLVSNISGKYWKWNGNVWLPWGADFLPAAFACFCYTNHASHVEPSSVLLELPHPNSFGQCSSSTLQASKMASFRFCARSRWYSKTQASKQRKHCLHPIRFEYTHTDIPKIDATQFMILNAACILSFVAKKMHLKLIPTKQSEKHRLETENGPSPSSLSSNSLTFWLASLAFWSALSSLAFWSASLAFWSASLAFWSASLAMLKAPGSAASGWKWAMCNFPSCNNWQTFMRPNFSASSRVSICNAARLKMIAKPVVCAVSCCLDKRFASSTKYPWRATRQLWSSIW